MCCDHNSVEKCCDSSSIEQCCDIDSINNENKACCSSEATCKPSYLSTNQSNSSNAVYLDYSATTPCDPKVVDAICESYQCFGNPHSITHQYGWDATDLVETSRKKIASIIKSDSKELIFTSGATESNNISIQGVVKSRQENGVSDMHIITTNIEHKATLETCHELEQNGIKVTYLSVEANGLLDLQKFHDAIQKNTVLASIGWVNSELGTIQPIKAIGEICKEKGILLHVDAAQALGRIKIDLSDIHVNLMSFSAHKFYGPKGIGALYIKRKTKVSPIVFGGRQEKGIRSGTVPVQLCVGMAKAAEIVEESREDEYVRMQRLQKKTLDRITSSLEDIYVNGDLDQRVPHNMNISFAYIEGEALMMKLKNYAMSSASACSSTTLQPSYVLDAIGIDENLIHTSLRIVMGRYTTEEDMDNFTNDIIKAVNDLRDMSPLWDMKKSGVDLKKVKWHTHH
ncbi:aminotransferase class V-fold PLP-dependent enzyme [Candidatus Cytomitobacter primus]|uniref:Cysteine desulfurase n=2 Tax=Candidatus Cytomitobacter primus TaxID=2066024 RepID=A0A5C0UGG9_9PROT|nr:aminotransferase class V-fold PLP-dependent enzyme [Candidatus Cytomitobacter primus]